MQYGIGVELKLECSNGIFPILSIELSNLNICNLIPEIVKAADIDAVHFRSGTRVAKWMDATKSAEPMFCGLVARLIKGESVQPRNQPEAAR